MKCQICGSEKNTVIATETRDGGGDIVQCCECGLVFQDYEYNDAELQDYYNTDYFETNSLDSESVQTPKDHFQSRLSTLESIKDELIELIETEFSDRKPRILEVGASAGELLFLMSDHASKLVGIELNEQFCDWANSELPDNIIMISKDLNTLEFDEQFDLIISNYTIDHLANPVETLLKMRNLLSDKGVMYILVPNRDEALNYYSSPTTKGCYQKFFWHKAHMFYFTKETLEGLFDRCGLKAQISNFHEYSLRNFLQWYFVGKPGQKFDEEVGDIKLFKGGSEFETHMNEMIVEMDKRFKEIMIQTWGGDTLRAIVRKKS